MNHASKALSDVLREVLSDPVLDAGHAAELAELVEPFLRAQRDDWIIHDDEDVAERFEGYRQRILALIPAPRPTTAAS